MSSISSHGAHILIFPYPAQGHMLAMLDLAHQLALRGLNLTVLVTPKNLPILDPLLSAHPTSIQTLVLPFPAHPSLPAGVENVRNVGNSGNLPIITALSKLHDPIAQWFGSHPDPPVAIVSDFFLGWTQRLARRLGIPRFAFYGCGAFFTSIFNHLWQNVDTIRSLPAVTFVDLPRSPVIKEEHFPTAFRVYKNKKGPIPDLELLKDSMIENISSWGVIFNSFDALEGEYMDHLKKTMGKERVWGVGPLNLVSGVEGMGRINPDKDSGDGVLAWLDGCPDGSVLYVCFGSQKVLNKAQMEGLGTGLERSGTRFVWVVKPASSQQQVEDGYGLLPDGFEDRVLGRGVVIKGWVPQTAILSHRAVGGFLSHCGWNSVLESVATGVMILAWPMEADQFLEARLMVEQMGAAVQVCEGTDSVPDSTELARIIGKAMSGDSVGKTRTKELRDKAIEAVKIDGSSWKDLKSLVEELGKLQS